MSSLHREISKKIKEEDDTIDISQADTLQLLDILYKVTLRPVYLFFDQSEELFIFDDKKIISEFFQKLQEILKSNTNIKIVLVMREDFIASLTPYEQYVKNLFDYRIRIEKMHQAKSLQEVIEGTLKDANVQFEDKEKTIESIIDKVKDKNGEVELTELNIFLDRLYKEKIKEYFSTLKIYTNGTLIPLIITSDFVSRFEKDKVIDDFVSEILKKTDAEVGEDGLTLNVLTEFLSSQNTKKSLTFEGLYTGLMRKYKDISESSLKEKIQKSIEALKQARIIKSMREE